MTATTVRLTIKISELRNRLQNIGATCPTSEELDKLVSEPKPKAVSETAWLYFKSSLFPTPELSSAKKTSPAPEKKNVRKRRTRKKKSSMDNKV